MKINLYNEDCAAALKKLEDNSVDFCLTDLPYGILAQKKKANYENDNRNFCDWDFQINYDEVLPELKRVMKQSGAIALFAKYPFTYQLYAQMIKHGFIHRYNWIWKKNGSPNFANMKKMPGNNYEEIMVFSKSKKAIKYFHGGQSAGITKQLCHFFSKSKRKPFTSEEVFDNFITPFFMRKNKRVIK